MAALVMVELLLRAFRNDDDDDDEGGGVMTPVYQGAWHRVEIPIYYINKYFYQAMQHLIFIAIIGAYMYSNVGSFFFA